MEYWRGMMDWQLDSDWRCETCGGRMLEWGMVHSQCRCYDCHTEYRMRDEQDKVVTVPICQLKLEYREPVKVGWKRYKRPMDEWTDAEWNQLMKKVASNSDFVLDI